MTSPTEDLDEGDPESASHAPDGQAAAPRAKHLFHRGDQLNYIPREDDYTSGTFLQDYVLKGWLPEEPFLTRGTKITAFGSCFAANITRHLSAIGYDLSSNRDPDVYISRLMDGLVNVASILGQLEWALENKKPAEPLWHGFNAERYGYDEGIRLRTRDVFLSTEFFIITLGLSEIWYDEVTGGTFWRAVPESAYDPARHKFRVLSVKETKHMIARMWRLVRTHTPNAKLLFTVSPIPLLSTFRPVSCLTANAVSKAVIRAALDEVLRRHEDDLNKRLFYFPSMELVQQGFVDPLLADRRHPSTAVLDTVMKTFEAAYCVGEATLEDANAMFQMYRNQNLRDIAARIPKGEEHDLMAKAAKAALRKSVLVRREQRAKQNELHKSMMGKRAAEGV
jgi:hypothetical protein